MIKSAAVPFAAVLIAFLPLPATPARAERKSPHEQASATLAGKKVTIDYGRPYKKGRAIFGGLVPLEKVWRTGADEATVLTTPVDLMIGSLRVPAGSYALFTIPGAKQWTLVVNKVAKQWGAFSYDAKQDLGRVPMTVAAAATVEQFTIALAPAGDKKLTLTLSWDTTTASVPVSQP
jgi:hypothetical protein